jgi:hypothetical protein
MAQECKCTHDVTGQNNQPTATIMVKQNDNLPGNDGMDAHMAPSSLFLL